jgi:U4/U6.U5 tri-snRNP-associated protein 3
MPSDRTYRTIKKGEEEDAEKGNGSVETYRSRTREKDRRRRDEEEDNYGDWTVKADSKTTSSRDYALERERRMARLREELKQEDEGMTALGQAGGAAGATDGSSATTNTFEDSFKPQETIIQVHEEELEGLDEEEQLRKLMGIESFGSTKGQKVEDNHKSSARGVAAKNKARKYRQYMNRKNGFNRPLEKMK